MAGADYIREGGGVMMMKRVPGMVDDPLGVMIAPLINRSKFLGSF